MQYSKDILNGTRSIATVHSSKLGKSNKKIVFSGLLLGFLYLFNKLYPNKIYFNQPPPMSSIENKEYKFKILSQRHSVF